MTEHETTEITNLVNDSLDSAESVWDEVGDKIIVLANEALNASMRNRAEAVPTHIPGHEFIVDGKPKVEEFVAFVLDIRDSSRHLRTAIANEKNVSMLKRVYYETAAVLPACSQIIKNQEGGVTEYLGDGLLAFFRVDKNNSNAALYASQRAAADCMEALRNIINPILYSRYQLPRVQIGIGLSLSDAILTLTGHGNFLKPTAFGICVFNATKLSKGKDEVIIDPALWRKWPTAADGTLRFTSRRIGDMDGYLMNLGT